MRGAPGLRALMRHGAGLDMIPVEAATAAGVLVANVPGANAVTVAEHVIWTALALLRRFREVNADLRADGWEAGRRPRRRRAASCRAQRWACVGMGACRAGAGADRPAPGSGCGCLRIPGRPASVPEGVAAVPWPG